MRQFLRYLSLSLIAGATLALELLQTKVLSALFNNHVAYLTITVAFVGFGTAGVFITLLQPRLQNIKALTAFCLAGFAITSLLSIYAASRAPLLLSDSHTLLRLAYCYLVLVPPFFFSGSAISLFLFQFGRDVYRLYFFDLAASALGVLAFCLLLYPLGAFHFLWLISIAGVFASCAYSAATGHSQRATQLSAGAVILLYSLFSQTIISTTPDNSKYGSLLTRFASDLQQEASRWHPIAKIDVFSDPDTDLITLQPRHSTPSFKLVTQDADAPTLIPSQAYRDRILHSPKRNRVDFRSNAVYIVNENPKDVAIIGVGGGLDVLQAKRFGAKRIQAVEINRATIDLLRGPYRTYAAWPDWPDVQLIEDDGRRFIRTSRTKFDVIQMTGVDTFAALSSGAYVLSENYLYTVEAMEDFLEGLKPNGTLFISRLLFEQPRESLRLVNLYLEAAERLGIPEPERNIMVIATPWPYGHWSGILLRKRPFKREHVMRVVRESKINTYTVPIYMPPVLEEESDQLFVQEVFQQTATKLPKVRTAFQTLITSSAVEREIFVAEYPHNIGPVFDDNPFFFEYFRRAPLSELWPLLRNFDRQNRTPLLHYGLYFLLAIIGSISLLSMIAPLLLLRNDALQSRGGLSLALFFSLLGIGFIFVELALIQRASLYLGQPIYSLSTVLGGLLFCTGLGSICTERFVSKPFQALPNYLLAVSVCSFLTYLAVRSPLLEATAHLPIAVRVIVLLALITPLGLLMGVPFATGLHYLHRNNKRFLPWAWGLNGLFSVLGSVAAIIVAMEYGFSSVALLGCTSYALAAAAIYRLSKSEESQGESADDYRERDPAVISSPQSSSVTMRRKAV